MAAWWQRTHCDRNDALMPLYRDLFRGYEGVYHDSIDGYLYYATPLPEETVRRRAPRHWLYSLVPPMSQLRSFVFRRFSDGD